MGQLNLGAKLNLDGTLTVNWTAVPGASAYSVDILLSGRFTRLERKENITGTAFTSMGKLTEGESYDVFVEAYNAASNRFCYESQKITMPSAFYKMFPLPIPQVKRVAAFVNTVIIELEEVPYADGYILLFNGKEYDLTSTAKKQIFSLVPDTSYTYSVKAYNDYCESEYSQPQTVTTPARSLAQPKNIKKSATENTAVISWDAVAEATGYELVFNGTSYWLTETTRTFDGLAIGTSYPFKVRGYNDEVGGHWSNDLTVTTIPGIPSNIVAEVTGDSALISWDPTPGANFYKRRFEDLSKEGIFTPNSHMEFSGLAPKTTYRYQICATNESGDGQYSPVMSFTTLEQTLDTPAIRSKEATDSSATISWDTIDGATSYDVRCSGITRNTAANTMTVSGLNAATDYSLQVRAKNAAGASVYSEAVTVATAPEPPTSFSTETTETTVKISWGAVEKATGYIVRFNNSETPVAGTTITFPNLTSNTAYTYQVCARSADGAGSYSAVKTAKTLPQVPGVPSNIRKTATGSTATISWGAVSGATSYVVKFNNTDYEVTATSRVFSGLSAGKSYAFQICARNAEGSSAYSDPMTVTTAPNPPIRISATSTADTVTVDWSATAGASGYIVLFNGKETPTEETTASFSGLDPGTSYTYQVCAKSVDGKGDYSEEKTIKTLKQVPGIPSNIRKTATGDSATVSWDAVSGAESYTVKFNNVTYHVVGTVREFSGLEAGTSYSFQICANNTEGSSAYSDPMTVTTAPYPPTDASAESTETTVTISWGAVEGAAGYAVLFNNAETPTEGTSASFSGLTPNTPYTYRICAKSVDGKGPYSAEKSIKTLPQLPGVPDNIRKTATENSVTLSWGAVSGATGYEVRMNNGVYQTETTTLTIPTLFPSTTYSFTIRAKNGEGAGAYTEPMAVTTAPDQPSTVGASSSGNNVTVSWSKAEGADGYIALLGSQEREVPASDLSCTFTGLNYNEDYTYQVCSKGGDGRSSYTKARTVRTGLDQEGALGIPGNIRKTVGGNSASFSWDAVEGASGYETKLVDASGKEYIGTVGTAARSYAGLMPGQSYCFQVRATSSLGGSAYSEAVTAAMPPAPPAEVTASAGEDTVTISWSPVEGAAGYVARCGSKEQAVGADVTSATFTGLTSNTEYTYKACATSVDGRGVYSADQTISTQQAQEGVLPAPAGVGYRVSQAFLTVSWEMVDHATSYELLLNGTTYPISALKLEVTLEIKPTTAYQFQVRAMNGAIGGEYSEQQTVISTPDSPEEVKLDVSETEVTVSWDAVEGATGYVAVLNGVEYPVDSPEITSVTIGGLEPGTDLECMVMTKNEYGTSVFPGRKSGKTTLYPPTGVQAAVDGNSVTISWNAVENATGYEISLDGQTYLVQDPAATSYTVEDLAPGSHTYTVRTRNEGGSGSPSGAGNVAILPDIPGIPTNIMASVLTTTVKVEWSNVEGAEGYEVLFDDVVYQTPISMKAFVDLEPDTYYSFAVRAYNARGYSDYSPLQEVRTLSALPRVPTNVNAKATSAYTIEVSWEMAPGTTSYEILAGGKTYEVADSPLGVDGLMPNTVYTYAVRAKNEYGTSGYSAAKSVRTLLEMPQEVRAFATESAATVSWYPVQGAESYEVLFGTRLYETIDTWMEIGELEENVEYPFKVRGKNTEVYGEYSPENSIRTQHLLAQQPLNVSATATSNSITVSWDHVSEASSYVVEFDGMAFAKQAPGAVDGPAAPVVAAAAAGEPVAVATALATGEAEAAPARMRHRFSGLKPNTPHTYRVRAVNSHGAAPFSILQTIRTRIREWGGLPEMARDRSYPDGRMAHLGMDPVNPLTGAFLWSYTFLEDYGKDRLHFTLMYDSLGEGLPKALGRGWSHALAYQLSMDGEYAYLHTPRGETIPFGMGAAEGIFHQVAETAPGYTMAAGAGGTYEVTDPDGMVYVFDSSLCLQEMRQWGEQVFRFQADGTGRILEIRGRHGASLRLSYDGERICGVALANGEGISLLYEMGHLSGISFGGGRSIYFGYDSEGRLAELKDSLGKTYLANSYDELGRVTRQDAADRGSSTAVYDEEGRTACFTDALGNITVYRYDEKGCLTEVSLSGSSIRRAYNDRGQVTEETDALGNVTTMGYDEKGRMSLLCHPDGTREEASYNDRGQPVRVVNRDGTQALYSYDEKGRLTSLQDERGNTCTYGYDSMGNLVSYTDREGHVWGYAYDAQGHLTGAQDPAGGTYRYSHDTLGRLGAHTSPEGRETRWMYGDAGFLESVTDGAGTESYTYDVNGSLSGITDRRGNRRQVEYNGMGQVSRATDFLGNATTYAYDGAGRLSEETDPLGYSLRYGYDGKGNLASLQDKNGGTTTYAYDRGSRLAQECDAAGNTWSYTYDVMGQVTSVTDPLGRMTTYAYDSAGRLASVTDALGQGRSYAYDPAGNLTLERDESGAETAYTYDRENRLLTATRAGKTWHYGYDSLGRLTTVEDPEGHREATGYGGDGSPTSFTDRGGGRTEYSYDSAGRLEQVLAPDLGMASYAYDANGNCTSVTDGEGHASSYAYDANNRLVRAVDPLGQETSYEYDARGDLVGATDPMGGRTAYEYDGNGNLVKETDALGGVKAYAYDSLGRLTEVRDQEGHVQAYTYDAVGNLASHTDANGNVRTYGYDALDRLCTVTAGDGSSVSYAYTPLGQVLEVTDQEGAVTSYEYDALGYLVKVTDGLGGSISLTHDSLGRVLAATDPEGNTWSYEYTPAGYLARVTDPMGNATAYTHDALGRMLTETDGEGNQRAYEYDCLGQVRSVTDALGARTSFTYTADGRIETVTDAEGGVTRYGYDACGNLTTVTDALGTVTRYEYDALGRRIKECLAGEAGESCTTLYHYDRRGCLLREVDPLGGEKSYAYDGNGNPVSIRDEEGQETRVTYDLNNLPLTLAYSGGRQAALCYNKRGQLVGMEDWTGITAIARDSLGRAVSVRDPRGYTVGYEYDKAGRRVGLTYPDGSRAAYAYDSCGRLSQVTDGESDSVRYVYDRAGNLSQLSAPGLGCAFTRNRNGQPQRAEYRLSDGTSIEEAFSYDRLGRVTGAARTGSSPGLGRQVSYAYDPLGRLLSWQQDGRTESYTYDPLGNRLTKSVDGSLAASYEYDAMNRLTGATEGGTSHSYTYDRRGSLTGEGAHYSYTYDGSGCMAFGRNLLTGEWTSYSYNLLGMRLGQTREQRTDGMGAQAASYETKAVEYVPDWLSPTDNDLMSFQEGRGSVRSLYGRGYECLGMQVSGHPAYFQASTPDRAWFGPGPCGSPLTVSDSAGNLLRCAARDPWGELETPAHEWDIPVGINEALRFTTYQYDPVIGKHYAKARFYDAGLGRMLSKDPIKNGLNAYAYCGNDPVNRVDPTGEVSILLGAIGGGLIGFGAGLIGSAVSQTGSGEEFDWGKAMGSAVNGAVTGAIKGALVSSGAGVVTSLAAEFAGGFIGSSLEQGISHGKVDFGKSLGSGLTNAVTGAIYGNRALKSAKSAFFRGAGAGAATAAINHLSDAWGSGGPNGGREGYLSGGRLSSWQEPYLRSRDARTICGVASPMEGSIGYRTVYGYQYETEKASGISGRAGKRFSLGDFFKDVATGAIIGGVSSTAFYGFDKAVGALKESVRNRGKQSNNRNIIISASGNPKDILFEGAELNKRQQELLLQLPNFGDRITIRKNDVNLKDISALTAHTGKEFALFTNSGRRMIIRGDSVSVPIDVPTAQSLAGKGWRWSGHSHPGMTRTVLGPSEGDRIILQQFKNQIYSVTVNSIGSYQRFSKDWSDWLPMY